MKWRIASSAVGFGQAQLARLIGIDQIQQQIPAQRQIGAGLGHGGAVGNLDGNEVKLVYELPWAQWEGDIDA
jgi:hypothetical protein